MLWNCWPFAQLHDHITPLLADLHWLRIPQRIQYKLCVLVFNCVHGTAPRYLQEVICPVENIESRRCLRSASSADLTVPATRRSTLGDRAFAVAGPRVWNTLPDAIRRCSSLDSFKRSLKNSFIHSGLFLMPSFWLVVSFWHCKVSLKYFFLFTAL